MPVAHKLASYLDRSGIQAEAVAHPRTATAMRTAKVTHVQGDRLAKGVLLKDGVGYLLAVVPASHHVELEAVQRLCGRPLSLADEDEIGRMFPDCELGAVPPVGAPYGLPVMVDDALAAQPDVYFEAGDHLTLLHVSGEQFAGLMQGVEHGRFSSPG
jgi:Ala-tRNA(Pro) deacylase